MAQLTMISRSDLEGLNVNLFTTGPAARIAQVDRRTFVTWAEKKGIKPVATLEGNRAVYLKEDVDKIAKWIAEDRAAKLKRKK